MRAAIQRGEADFVPVFLSDIPALFLKGPQALHVYEPPPAGPVEDAVGEHIAALVEDGATLQVGIGAIPDAVLRRLRDKRDLGIHTEMFSDGVVDLVEPGAVTNRLKQVHRGRITTSFVYGSRRLYDYVNDNRSSSSIRAIGRTTRRSSAATTRPRRSTQRSKSISRAR